MNLHVKLMNLVKTIVHSKVLPISIKFNNIIAKQRPRYTAYTNVFYNPNQKQEGLARQHVAAVIRNRKLKKYFPIPSGIPLGIELIFNFKVPKSTPKYKIEQLKDTWYPKRMDIDNATKFYLDVCNKLLYEDDRSIVLLQAEKIYRMTADDYTILTLHNV